MRGEGEKVGLLAYKQNRHRGGRGDCKEPEKGVSNDDAETAKGGHKRATKT